MSLLVAALLLSTQPSTASPAFANWIAPPDYPQALVSQGKQGRVEFRLTFDHSGRVIGCAIQKSAGDALLDATACRLSLRRARATAGQPRVNDYYVDWRVPEPR